MAESPRMQGNDTVALTITVNGATMDETYQVVDVLIEKAANRIPWAKIELTDGSIAEADFPVSNTETFSPGAKVAIQAGYGQQTDKIFEGIVIQHKIQILPENDARLIVECRDVAVKMTVGRKNANYLDMTDSEIIKKLIGNYSGPTPDVATTQVTYGEIVQYYATDWDFLLSRAEVNGMLVMVDDGKIAVKAPDVKASAKLTVTYGDDLIELEAGMDARSQFASVKGAAWDLQTQKMVEVQSDPAVLNQQGNITSKELSKVVGLSDYRLQTTAPLDQNGLKAWTDAQQLKSGLSRIRGRMKFQGSAKVKPGDLVELAGAGDRFNGAVFVGKVSHTISQGDWLTTVSFGMSPNWFAEAKDIQAPDAGGLLPGITGLQIGVVVQINDDPGGQYRVKVNVPVLQADTQGIWARLSSPYASEDIGSFFFPEIGDEVVLGYFNNDPSHPVILGSLYSSKRKPSYALEAGNNRKALITRSKMKIEFDEEKKIITIATAGGNEAVLSDDGKSISLTDQNNNTVTLDNNGISLDSPKDVTIKATGRITLSATDQIGITSNADLKLSGLNIENNANVGFTAKGNATAEVSASGQTTVKGAMVMIN